MTVGVDRVQGPPAPLIPVENFFRAPAIAGAEVSPSGNLVAFRKPWKGRLNIYTRSSALPSGEEVRLTEARDRGIPWFLFANDSTLIYKQDTGGDENYHLFAVAVDGSSRRNLTPFPGVNAGLVDRLRANVDHVLIHMNRRDRRLHDVYRVNLETGHMEMVTENTGNVTRWGTDHEGAVRLAWKSDGEQTELLHRSSQREPFEHVLYRTSQFAPKAFTFDNERLIAISVKGRDRGALVEYDLERRKEVAVLYENPSADVSGVHISRARRLITGVTFKTWKVQRHHFDPTARDLRLRIEALFPGRDVSIVSTTRDEQRMVVRTYSDRDLGAYFLYDVENEKISRIAEVSPWIDPEQMAPMHPIHYRARDGLTIHGYLTLPRGAGPTALPTVVLPHGGPFQRDSWQYQAEVQFLANRGYAVLQPNFRGSAGYGSKFMAAGYKQYGRAMQDDITDGVAWLVRQGVADPKRICIYGASYGGFAALAGLAFTPDLSRRLAIAGNG